MSNRMNLLIFLIGLACIIQTGLAQLDVLQETPPTNTPPTTLPISIFGDQPTTTTTTTPAPVPSTTEGVTIPESKIGSECNTAHYQLGTCTPLPECYNLIAQLRESPNDDNFVNFLKRSNKMCGNEYPLVCCPEVSIIFPKNTNEIPRKLPSIADGCGYVEHRSFWKIHPALWDKVRIMSPRKSNTAAKPQARAWPWIALIGYDDGVSPSSFKCGGALITSRHVLTAAHCIRSDLSFVRLGERDLSTETEANHVDVPVVKNLRHPRYNKTDGRNDIALLYLGQNVEFSEKITPICLPFEPRLRLRNITGLNPFVAGWGRTMEGGNSSTDVIQELEIKVFDNEVCQNNYKKQGKFVSEEEFDSAVICAGDSGGGKDTCQGDSGGPLMLSDEFESSNLKRFDLIGIFSNGIGCAKPDIPGVYTRVTNYIEWIENGVADTP